MPPAKGKRPANGRSSSNSITHSSGTVNGNGHDIKDENPIPGNPVIDTPFSIDMFQEVIRHPYDDRKLPPKLNTIVQIRPEAIWASLTKYNSFIIHNHKHGVHHYALVSRFQPLPKIHDPCEIDEEVIYPARILEIRAKDAKNVYIRLYWLYMPDHLPSGRQPYHGKDELIATNHMEIVDASRVIKPITVVDLRRREGSGPTPEMYWRQTFHVLTEEVSPPQSHCICANPVCPDDTLVRCTNPQCALTLHGKCIEDAKLAKLHLQQQQPQSVQIQPRSGLNDRKADTTQQKGTADVYEVQLIISQRPKHHGQTRLRCRDLLENRFWELDVKCLGCGSTIR
ncbi:MAG: hypothetical protein Q9168_004753 [Polycauliona sp. 1 TL-2023]